MAGDLADSETVEITPNSGLPLSQSDPATFTFRKRYSTGWWPACLSRRPREEAASVATEASVPARFGDRPEKLELDLAYRLTR